MKTKLALSLLLAVTAVSCGSFTVKPGSDALVVYSEYTSEQALVLFDSFLKWERENETLLLKVDPDIHKSANMIRDNGKKWIQELNTAIRNYKLTRNDANKTALLVAKQFLDLAITELRANLAKGGAK